jgi:hypothetical protein
VPRLPLSTHPQAWPNGLRSVSLREPSISERTVFARFITPARLCSSSDEGRDALMQICHRRYSGQIELADAETILMQWHSV